MPRISELPALAQATSGDIIPIVDDAGNITKKVTANKVVPDGSVVTSQLGSGAVTTAKIGDAQVTAPKLDFTTLAFGNYSTSEVNTNMTWIDGKTIYKKTINFGGLTNATAKNVAHGITGIDYIIKIEATAKAASGTHFPLPWVNNANSTAAQIALFVTTSDITIHPQSDRTGTNAFVTLLYTKV